MACAKMNWSSEKCFTRISFNYVGFDTVLRLAAKSESDLREREELTKLRKRLGILLRASFHNYAAHPVSAWTAVHKGVYARDPLVVYTTPKSCDRTVRDAYSSRTRVGPSTILCVTQ